MMSQSVITFIAFRQDVGRFKDRHKILGLLDHTLWGQELLQVPRLHELAMLLIEK
jgi:hypothetical protein